MTDTVLATIDLSKKPIKASGPMQRVRRLVIQPGGIAPWHSLRTSASLAAPTGLGRLESALG